MPAAAYRGQDPYHALPQAFALVRERVVQLTDSSNS
jgi:hypothetical protein